MAVYKIIYLNWVMNLITTKDSHTYTKPKIDMMKKNVFLILLTICVALLHSPMIAQTSHTGMRDMTGLELTEDMAPGINLFNTLDASCTWLGKDQGLVTETCWGQPYTTPEMIASFAQRGFKTLRLPVTWYMHTGDAPNYTIDPLWMDRVEEVANYAFDYDMYVIINIHHDDYKDTHEGTWLSPVYADSTENIDRLEKVWTQIANRFKDYGDYLIFETLNEPRQVGSQYEWSGGSEENKKMVSRYNEVSLETIRQTGGNNASRFVMMPQVAANGNSAKTDWVNPGNDSKVIVSIHAYSPFWFALDDNNTDDWGSTQEIAALQNEIGQLSAHFVANGQAVVMGEWGVTGSKPEAQRINYYDIYTKACKDGGIVPVTWIFGFNKTTLKWSNPEVEESILKHYYPIIDNVTFTLPKDTIFVGDEMQLYASITPSNTDIRFTTWLTSDLSLASINKTGLLTAHKEGKVTVSVGINGSLAYQDLVILDTVVKISHFIEAEDYTEQSGVQTESTADVGGGLNIGFLDNNDWSSYTVMIDSAGTYEFYARAATLSSGGNIQIEVNGVVVSNLTIDGSQSTGWQDWFTTEAVELDLEEGENTIKLTYTSTDWGLFNINWYQLEYKAPLDNDIDNDGVLNHEDCNPTDPNIGAATLWYQDEDGDDLGNPNVSQSSCSKPAGYVGNMNDQNDDDADNDGVSAGNDCDDNDANVGAATLWYQDTDNDGTGDANASISACQKPNGYVASTGDLCPDDQNKLVPGTCGCGVVDIDIDKDDICDDIDDNVVTNLLEQEEKSLIQFSPNPTTGHIQLSETTPYEVYNLVGVRLLSGEGSEIDLSDLPNGVYIMVLHSKRLKVTKK